MNQQQTDVYLKHEHRTRTTLSIQDKFMKTYRFSAVIEKDEDCYFASCPQLQGCHTQGESYEEALENLKDALRLYLETLLEAGEDIPEPGSVSLTMVEVVVPA